jgi:hypothetical protein
MQISTYMWGNLIILLYLIDEEKSLVTFSPASNLVKIIGVAYNHKKVSYLCKLLV